MDYLPAMLLVIALLAFLSRGIAGIRLIPDNREGVVEKRFNGRCSLEQGFIALAGPSTTVDAGRPAPSVQD